MTEDGPDVWSFALAVYGRPGVEAACLHLQDAAGADVPLALFAVWAGAVRGHRLDKEEVRRVAEISVEWQRTVVAPLRAVRRALKPLEAEVAGTAALRADVKRAELAAERLQLARLEARFMRSSETATGDRRAAAAANLRAVLTLRTPADAAAVETILAAAID